MMLRVGRLAASLSILVAATASAAADEPSPKLPRLAGTVVGPMARQALIELGAQQISVAQGDDIGGWVIESIAPGHVVLAGPDGPISVWIATQAPSPPDARTPPPDFSWDNPCGRSHRIAGHRDGVACRSALAAAGLP